MNEEKESKIKYFLGDSLMSEAVKEVMLKTFLEDSQGSDVNTLAAERIAIKLLNKAFKNLENYKGRVENKLSDNINIGL